MTLLLSFSIEVQFKLQKKKKCYTFLISDLEPFTTIGDVFSRVKDDAVISELMGSIKIVVISM